MALVGMTCIGSILEKHVPCITEHNHAQPRAVSEWTLLNHREGTRRLMRFRFLLGARLLRSTNVTLLRKDELYPTPKVVKSSWPRNIGYTVIARFVSLSISAQFSSTTFTAPSEAVQST